MADETPTNQTSPDIAPLTPGATGAAGDDAEQLATQALAQAEASLDVMKNEVGDGKPLDLPDLASEATGEDPPNSIELLNDVDLHVTVELGRTQMLVEDVLRLSKGSVVELDKLAGDPVDVYVNKRLVARGEVLVLNDSFCIRVSEIVANLEEQATEAAAAEHAAAAKG
jgi:flagellar motor switch protein FliN/FliY